MISQIKAIIFDMDGVIIDSEPLWKQAEYEVFSSVGVKLSDELCYKTQFLTTVEVTQFWYEHFPWDLSEHSLSDIENAVINRVAKLIDEQGQPIDGIITFVEKLKSENYKIGMATNSPACLITVVLQKLKLEDFFDATSSSEFEEKGKPHPAVYLSTAKKLGIQPENCLAIEDSTVGAISAQNANMKIKMIKNGESFHNISIEDFFNTAK